MPAPSFWYLKENSREALETGVKSSKVEKGSLWKNIYETDILGEYVTILLVKHVYYSFTTEIKKESFPEEFFFFD